jgi:4-amino-4-deoxy-L-arabinose transferase-like glycosyltransferase
MTEADGTYEPHDIEKLLIYSKEYDAVLGTRTSRATIWSGAFMPFPVRFGNWAVAKFLEVLHNGTSLSDVGCTYKLITRDVLERIKPLFKLSQGDGKFSPELMIWLIMKGARMIEVPVAYKQRIGQSMYTGSIWKAAVLGAKMLPLIVWYRLYRISTSRWKTAITLGLIAILFIALHLAGIHVPYHQDEYKWQMYANPALYAPGSVPHPPLTELIYRVIGHAVGYGNFRVIPFAFGLMNLFLIFVLARIMYSARAGLWAATLFTLTFFSLLASLMVDTDGAILPFFLLLMAIPYYRLRDSGFRTTSEYWRWWALLIAAALGGFLVKVSFAIGIAAFGIDFAIINGAFSDRRRFVRFTMLGILLAMTLVAALALGKLLFPFFPIEKAITYWEHFVNFSDFLHRGWLQTLIQTAKALMYLSPLLIALPFFGEREDITRARPFLFFIAIGLVFYVLLFDFSLGALDRYYEYLVVPLVLMGAAALSHRASDIRFSRRVIWSAIALAITVGLLQFLPHATPPLYPKTEWLHRLVSFDWLFLFPFMGGSGPIPMYVSFLFIAAAWAVSAACVVASRWYRTLLPLTFACVLAIGVAYNASFIEEYLWGGINGSSADLAREVAGYVADHPEVTAVTVYNDNGAYEMMQTGKYDHRLYVDPKFDIAQKIDYLNTHKEFYSVIDIPHLDPGTVYARFFGQCKAVFSSRSGTIAAFLYDCRGAPDVSL